MASEVIKSLQYHYRNLMAGNNCEEVCNIREECCVLCKSSFEDDKKSVSVSHKGILTIIEFSKKRGRLDLVNYLTENIDKKGF